IGLSIRAFVRLEWHRFTTGVRWFEAKMRIIRDAVRAAAVRAFRPSHGPRGPCLRQPGPPGSPAVTPRRRRLREEARRLLAGGRHTSGPLTPSAGLGRPAPLTAVARTDTNQRDPV